MISNLLSRGFHRNQGVIRAQADGLTHAESLTQTDYKLNCFNWVVGHIVSARNDILELLGAEKVMSAEQAERYLRESDPITEDGPGVMAFDELLALLDASEERLEEVLGSASEGSMAEELPVKGNRTSSRAAQIMFWYFHETYHTGQTEIMRQISGRADKII